MKIRTLALVGGALLAALGGMGAVACSSSDNSGNPTTPGPDSSTPGRDANVPPGQDANVPPGQDANVPPTDGGAPDCGSIPSLHSTDAGDIFCGYTAGEGGTAFSCNGATAQCCLGGKVGAAFDPEQCQAFGSTCTNPAPPADGGFGGGLPIQCGQNSDCITNGGDAGFVAGSVSCCLKGSIPAAVPGCGYAKAQGGTGVVCQATAACAAGDTQVCSSTADCPTGKTCTPMKWKLYQMGYCL